MATWRGRPLADLADHELAAAEAFVNTVVAEIQQHSPLAIYAFFSTALSDLTIERARRLSAKGDQKCSDP